MRAEFTRRCHAVEEAYEYMLGYAAQGLSRGAAGKADGQLREVLTRAVEALAGVGEVLNAVVSAEGLAPAEDYHAFRRVLEQDAQAAGSAMRLVLAQPEISSQLVDNLNASIHVRALLTDLFVIDEILSPQSPVQLPQASQG
jgi:hypothetical protein